MHSMTPLSTSSTTPIPRPLDRHWWRGAVQILGALVVVFLSVFAAAYAARWLLRDVDPASAHAATTTVQLKPTPHAPAATDVVALGMGATQSYRGLAVTITDLRLVATSNFVAAPPGMIFACVTVTLANTDPVQAVPYNAADIVLVDARGGQHHQSFAALATPLGAGLVAPDAQVQGDLAFLVAYPPSLYANDPQIRYAPPGANLALAWDVPLAPILP
jgi:hypothetical protein